MVVPRASRISCEPSEPCHPVGSCGVVAVLVRDDPRHQLQFGGMLFGGFIAFALVVGWVLYLFPL